MIRDPANSSGLKKFLRRKGEGYSCGEERYNTAIAMCHPAMRITILSLVVVQMCIAGMAADNPTSEVLKDVRLAVACVMVVEITVSNCHPGQ